MVIKTTDFYIVIDINESQTNGNKNREFPLLFDCFLILSFVYSLSLLCCLIVPIYEHSLGKFGCWKTFGHSVIEHSPAVDSVPCAFSPSPVSDHTNSRLATSPSRDQRAKAFSAPSKTSGTQLGFARGQSVKLCL